MSIIKKSLIDINNNDCHSIIRKRNKYLIDHSIPKLTNGDIIPPTHLPINFIEPINDIIFNKINKNIINQISILYNENISNLTVNTTFYVENSYEYIKEYYNCNFIDHSYIYIILLNEKSYYQGGEICLNNNIIELNDDELIIVQKNDLLNIRNILSGEQHKIIGYINNTLIDDNFNKNIQLYSNLHIHEINNIINDELSSIFYDKYKNIKNDSEFITHTIIDDEEKSIFSFNSYKNIIEINNLNENLKKNNKLISVLDTYNIKLGNMLPYNIFIIKKSLKNDYFSPINSDNKIKDQYLKNIDCKYTLLININHNNSQLVFIDTNYKINLKKNCGILIPNSFLYKFYINKNQNDTSDIYLLKITYF